MKNSVIKAHLALLGANVIYGVNFLIAKGVMPNKIGPSAFIFLRIAGAGLLFWIIKFFLIKERVKKIDLVKLALLGLIGIATNQLLFFHGLNLTSPIDASIIMTTVPVIVLIFSAFILKEKITPNKLAGILCGGVGAVFLIWYGKNASGTSSFLGNLFIFLNACSYGLYLVLVKPLMKKYKPLTIISWVFLFGFLFVLPFGIPDMQQTNFSAFTTQTYLAVGFVIVFTTFLTYLFNIYALKHIAPSISGSYIYLQPVVSFLMVSIYAYALDYTEYAKDINGVKIASCFLVVIGVYLISKKPKTHLK